MKHLIGITCLALMWAACASDDTSENKIIDQRIEVRKVAVITLYQGDIYGLGFSENYSQLITNQLEWLDVAQKLDKVKFLGALDVDFQFFEVLMVTASVYSYQGHSIDVVDIEEFDDYLKVQIDHIMKGNDAPALCQPVHLVKIPKLGKRLVLEEV